MTTLIEGKTKRIVSTKDPHTVELQAIDRLTGGDAARLAEISDIGIQKTKQTANVFELLSQAGIPTAFLEQNTPSTLLCRNCEMLPLEFVTRRYAFGSFLKRLSPDDPIIVAARRGQPHRFEQPLFELFHKDTVVALPDAQQARQITENEAREKFLNEGKWAEGVYTDPFVDWQTSPTRWGLYSAKSPIAGTPLMSISPTISNAELQDAIDTIVLPTFNCLEKEWAQISTHFGPIALVDMKIELGRDKQTGDLLLADVIDNDSWRVWPGADPANQLDKQAFRDGETASQVAEKYALVTELTNQFNRV